MKLKVVARSEWRENDWQQQQQGAAVSLLVTRHSAVAGVTDGRDIEGIGGVAKVLRAIDTAT